MQQVGAKAFAAAIAVDPVQLPALLNPPQRRRAMFGMGRVWVLHRTRVLRGVAVLAICAGLGSIYATRDRLAEAGGALYQLGLTEIAKSPFGVQEISITGQALTSEKTILAALAITPQTSMFNFDADTARNAIEALPTIAEATVRKQYPNHVFISVTEREPVARWRLDGVTYIIDSTGAKIAADGVDYPSLPLVVGDEAGDDAMVMTRAMDMFPALKKGLVALSRIADRRWDMIYNSGVRVELPEQGVAQALAQLMTLEEHFQILERDVTLIDLRVAGLVAVKPSDDAAKQLAAIAKANIAKNKGNFKEDADYSAPAR